MTAEIIVMNRQAIAVAADSAVTLKMGKVFSSANKIFSLSKYQPIGVMIYQNAEFMGVPWETIIKKYRESLGQTRFGSLNEYANHFFEFLSNRPDMFPDEAQDQFISLRIYQEYARAQHYILEKIEDKLEKDGQINKTEIRQFVNKALSDIERFLEKTNQYSTTPEQEKSVMADYQDFMLKTQNEVFEKLPITKANSRRIMKIVVSSLTRYTEGQMPDYCSGVVFMGFGEDEYFPVVRSFILEGLLYNTLLFQPHIEGVINHQQIASIIPFAQREMVYLFMEGIDQEFEALLLDDFGQMLAEYPRVILSSIKELDRKRKNELRKEIREASRLLFEQYRDHLKEYRRAHFVNPVMNIVSSLPKDELAAMAEALVSLTSFKRRVSEDLETVGGPIDVALISKGDGFIWIKRKHYFLPELNHAFFKQYFREVKDGDE